MVWPWGCWLALLCWLLALVSETGGGYPAWCEPRLWEGREWSLHITHTDSGAQVWEVHSQFSVDVIGNRYVSLQTVTGEGRSYTVYNLFYYDANTLYTVRDGQCTTTHIEGNVTQQCMDLPNKDEVEYRKESLGGNNAYQVVSASLRTLNSDGVSCFHSVDVDYPSVPLIRETHGVIGGVPTYRLSSYYNVTYSIQNPGVFTPPAVCVQSSSK